MLFITFVQDCRRFLFLDGGKMKVSITIEAMLGLTWPLWKQMVSELDVLGFATVFRSDHFSLGAPPVTDALELITSLTYLADHTQRVDFGSLVAPVSVRNPVMLARQAMSLNDLSEGRMILGVGSGWLKEEHAQFGYSLGDPKTRMDRLEEALQVITCLVRSEEPVSFQGRFYRLQEARLLPRPQQPTPILVGGNGPKRTLPLVARFANIWNCQLETPESFQQLSTRLDNLIVATNRAPSDVKRTAMVLVFLFHNQEELQHVLNQIRKIPFFIGLSDEDILYALNSMHAILGGPDEVIKRMQAYSEAGVEEFVIQCPLAKELDYLQTIAREILPIFATTD
jgi:alkanesulfonate monooxygenase SsuD/methylene tetrahydromethanopterin reductase-like flavin-dependent oxidoreductase (luciferase family)